MCIFVVGFGADCVADWSGVIVKLYGLLNQTLNVLNET